MKTPTFVRAGIILASFAATSLGLAQGLAPGPQNHTNGPPSVRIVTPQEGEAFLLGHKINICALSQNFTDALARVEFLAATNIIGVVTNHPAIGWRPPCGALEGQHSCITWSNAALGAYELTAEATDLAGNSVTSAPVDITVVTNLPPLVRIVKPQQGALILGPTNITLYASASDPDGTVASVQFFEGTNSLGVVTNMPTVWVTNRCGIIPIRHTSYSLTWSNVAPGDYTLTAEATDNGGAVTTSAAVDISVVTNLPPLVKIVNPTAGARFYAPADIDICAGAKDPDGTVAYVEFFEGTNSLGVATNGVTVTNKLRQVQTLYCLSWSNVPPAAYALTAVATDNGGDSSTSAPVQVTVLVPPPPLVKIIYPENGAKFTAPANICIATVTRYFTNHVASVQFLAGTNTLAVLTNSSWPTFYWKHVPAGAYSLTAVATDTAGIKATSTPVNITVRTNCPPPRWVLKR